METEKPKTKKSTAKTVETSQQELAGPPAPTVTNTSAAAPAKEETPATPGNETEQRENARVNEKIDEWIKRNPKQFEYYNGLSHERAVRKLILNEIDNYERREKAKLYRQQEQGEDNAPRHDTRRSYGGGMRR